MTPDKKTYGKQASSLLLAGFLIASVAVSAKAASGGFKQNKALPEVQQTEQQNNVGETVQPKTVSRVTAQVHSAERANGLNTEDRQTSVANTSSTVSAASVPVTSTVEDTAPAAATSSVMTTNNQPNTNASSLHFSVNRAGGDDGDDGDDDGSRSIGNSTASQTAPQNSVNLRNQREQDDD